MKHKSQKLMKDGKSQPQDYVVLNKVLTGGILWKKVVLKNFANLIGKHVVGVTF